MSYSYEHECSISVERNGETVDVELVMDFDVDPPEPDVGLFGYGVSDCEFRLSDGSPLPEDVAAAIAADDGWEERQCAKAIEDFEPDDYFAECQERRP